MIKLDIMKMTNNNSYKNNIYKIFKYSLGIISVYIAMFFTSCEPCYDTPPMIVPVASWQANTTIYDLKEMFYTNTPDIPEKSAGVNYIIKGKVIGNDVSGNIYKNLMIQDETAAITIGINGTGLFNTYHLGQELVINCTGLSIGRSSGNIQQLGTIASGSSSIGWLELPIFQEHVQLNGLPFQPVDTLHVAISDLGTTKEDLLKYQSQLVQFTDVFFKGGGVEGFTANNNRTTRYLYNSDASKSLPVLNSQYSDFATKIMPDGIGNVVSILSYYNNNYQLLLIQDNNWFDFTGTTPEVINE